MVYRRRISLQETDATGVIHFTAMLKFAIEAFEQFLHDNDLSVQKMIDKSPYLLPIVHVEADYFAPITVDDTIEIILSLEKMSEKAFHIGAAIKKEGKVVGKTTTVHVQLDRATREAVALEPQLKALLGSV